MSNINDGGPAFPRAGMRPDVDERSGIEAMATNGMTLRDYFAAKALTGMIASAPVCDRSAIIKSAWACIAYEWADAMLAARAKEQGK